MIVVPSARRSIVWVAGPAPRLIIVLIRILVARALLTKARIMTLRVVRAVLPLDPADRRREREGGLVGIVR